MHALWHRVEDEIGEFLATLPVGTVIVSGGAEGVDDIAACMAVIHYGLDVEVYKPDYKKLGRRAPLERNTLIVNDCDEVHAWPAPWSRGTWDTIRKAKAAGKPVTVHEVK